MKIKPGGQRLRGIAVNEIVSKLNDVEKFTFDVWTEIGMLNT